MQRSLWTVAGRSTRCAAPAAAARSVQSSLRSTTTTLLSSHSHSTHSTTTTTTRTFSILSSIKDKVQNKMDERRVEKLGEKFNDFVSQMVNTKVYTLDVFYKYIKQSAEEAGATGWKSMIPGMSSQAGIDEIKRSLAILEAMTPAEREHYTTASLAGSSASSGASAAASFASSTAYAAAASQAAAGAASNNVPHTIDRVVKARVAEQAKCQVADVNFLLRQFATTSMTHKWLHSRIATRQPLPTSQDEMMRMMQEDRPTAQAKDLGRRKPRRR